MAAAHVSATAALIRASGVLGPDPSAKAIEGQLKKTARDLGTPGKGPPVRLGPDRRGRRDRAPAGALAAPHQAADGAHQLVGLIARGRRAPPSPSRQCRA